MTPKQLWQLLKENDRQINTLIQITILIIASLAYWKVQVINVDLNHVKGKLADYDRVIAKLGDFDTLQAGNISLKFGNKTFTALTTNGSYICSPEC